MRHRRLAPFFCPLLAACSTDLEDSNADGVADGVYEPNNVTVVSPSRPRGFVAGQLLDGTTGLPLPGATVAVFGGGVTGEQATDANGQFSFGPLEAGARFSLHAERQGYTDATLTGLTIDDAAGNFPTENGALFVGPIGLLPTTGQFRVQVIAEAGVPVAGAEVVVETAVRYYERSAPRGSMFASATTDGDGMATVSGLPNVWGLPPRNAAHAALVVDVAPVDFDGDGSTDLDGRTLAVTGNQVRAASRPPVIVLRSPDSVTQLQVIASNVPGLAGVPAGAPPTVLAAADPIRIVFNLDVDRESFIVDLLGESGDQRLATSVVTGATGNLVTINHAAPFAPGQEYNLYIQAQTLPALGRQSIRATGVFFSTVDDSRPVRVSSRYVDKDADDLWGTGNDALEIELDIPVGIAGRNPAFTARLFLQLDLDGSGIIGDGRGELPALMEPYPAAIPVNAAEPMPANRAGLSGYTRVVSPLVLPLAAPLTELQGPIALELRFDPAANNGVYVTDVSGRPPPPMLEGFAQLTK